MGISISSESTKFFTLLKLPICQEKKVFLSSFTLCECVSGTLQVTEKIMAFSSTVLKLHCVILISFIQQIKTGNDKSNKLQSHHYNSCLSEAMNSLTTTPVGHSY